MDSGLDPVENELDVMTWDFNELIFYTFDVGSDLYHVEVNS